MTVTYIHRVPSAAKIGAFFRLLVIWKGSVMKGIWKDLAVFCVLYSAISLSYRYLMVDDEPVKSSFEKICVYMNKFSEFIPISFLLGFYVSQVMVRWWEQFSSLPWLDNLCLCLSQYLPGPGLASSRRQITRYALVSMLITFSSISHRVAKKYKNFQTLVEAGLLTEKEKQKLEDLRLLTEYKYPVNWFPIQWAQSVLKKCYGQGKISSDLLYDRLNQELLTISARNGTLLSYAWVNIPLVYTQVRYTYDGD